LTNNDFDDVSIATVSPPGASPPGAPQNVAGSPLDSAVSLTWDAPASDGGSMITGYRVTSYVNGVAQTSLMTGSSSTSFRFGGLTNGTTYTFTVAALNAAGTGVESAPSPPVTPVPAPPPGPPSNVNANAGDHSAALTWTAPTSDGGSPITSYRITPYIGANAQTPVTTPSAATGFTVTGLTNGTTYTFRVAAINSIGTGANSAASPPITPAIPPANPIVLENRNQGTTSWQLDIDHKAENHQIEGYASATSVNKG